MKKILALFLAALVCLTLPLTAFAAAPAVETGALQNAADRLKENVTAMAENAKISVDGAKDELTDLILDAFHDAGALLTAEDPQNDANLPAVDIPAPTPLVAGKALTPKELAREIRRYMFIRIDDPDAVAALIADSCDFDYAVVEDSHGTIFIRVDIENNPQIFNYDVFRKLVEKLYERQNEEIKTDSHGNIDYVMSYEHIAGELALHAIVFAFANGVIAATDTKSEKIRSLYNSAAVAELNVNESRAPGQLIVFLGKLIINVFRYNFLKLFSFLA